jgi:hypothetical protein
MMMKMITITMIRYKIYSITFSLSSSLLYFCDGSIINVSGIGSSVSIDDVGGGGGGGVVSQIS